MSNDNFPGITSLAKGGYKPFVLESDNTVYVDIDDTIVKWNASREEQETNGIVFNNYGYNQLLVPHKRHIEMIKLHKARGHKIIFWSAGGWEWAKEVVTTLELTEYADAILSKPKWIYDDLPASSFIPESCRIFKKDSEPKEIKECNAEFTIDELENKYRP